MLNLPDAVRPSEASQGKRFASAKVKGLLSNSLSTFNFELLIVNLFRSVHGTFLNRFLCRQRKARLPRGSVEQLCRQILAHCGPVLEPVS